MSLRTDWSKTKNAADTGFKIATSKANTASVLDKGEVIGNPLKFKEDLGPTLDKYEAAKTPADKKKYGEAAKVVIKSYLNQIATHKKTLDSADPRLARMMSDQLKEIEAKLK